MTQYEHTCAKCGEEIRSGEPRWSDFGEEGEQTTTRDFHRRCSPAAIAHDQAVARSRRQYAAWLTGARRRGYEDGVSDG